MQSGAAPGGQVPAWQVSPVVHALVSLQVVPLALTGFEQVPLEVSQTPAVWHWSCAVQVTTPVVVQTPAWQLSPVVQPLPSVQVAPSVLLGFEQRPDVVSQVPTLWHWSSAVQVTVLAGVQVPVWQVSPVVQALPSVHVVPLAFDGFEQVPLKVSQMPASWHWSEAVQTTAVPVQAPPAVHASAEVQRLLSLQEAPTVRLPQVPLADAPAAMLQAWQSLVPPPQAVLQQTPSTQNPDPHCEFIVQAVPRVGKSSRTPTPVASPRTPP